MERFFTYWHPRIVMDQSAQQYLLTKGQVRSYSAGTDFTLAGQVRPFWCFVLSGLVASVEYVGNDRELYNWLVRPGDYFTGTLHLFTIRPPRTDIRFLRHTELLLIPVDAMKYGQQHFIAISELLHVLKQRHILRQDTTLLLLLFDSNHRYAYFRRHMHDLFVLLDEKEQIALLRMSRSQFFAAKAAWKGGGQ